MTSQEADKFCCAPRHFRLWSSSFSKQNIPEHTTFCVSCSPLAGWGSWRSLLRITVLIANTKDYKKKPFISKWKYHSTKNILKYFKMGVHYWGIADSQCCGSFRWTVKGLSLAYACTHSSHMCFFYSGSNNNRCFKVLMAINDMSRYGHSSLFTNSGSVNSHTG